MENDKIAKKIDLCKGSGNRSAEEKRIGNNYLDCDYKEED